MVAITARIRVAAPAEAVWATVTDWTNHERWIPLTKVTILTGDQQGIGARFVARTGLGPLSVDDVMELTAWAPPAGDLPGRWAVVKRGRLVHGGARFEVQNLPAEPSATSGNSTSGKKMSLVTWSEELTLAPERLSAPLAPLIWVTGRFGLVRALRIMAHELEREH